MVFGLPPVPLPPDKDPLSVRLEAVRRMLQEAVAEVTHVLHEVQTISHHSEANHDRTADPRGK